MIKKLLHLALLLGVIGIHPATAQTPPMPIPSSVLTVDPGDGVVVPFPEFDLSQSTAKWSGSQLDMTYTSTLGGGYWKMGFTGSQAALDYNAKLSTKSVPLEPNLNYTLSLLVYYDFPDPASEINLGIRTVSRFVKPYSYSSGGATILKQDVKGIMGGTLTGSSGTWVRWQMDFTTPPIAGDGIFQFVPRFRKSVNKLDATFCIAQCVLIKKPARTLTGYAQGEGADFSSVGSVGNLGMRINTSGTWSNVIKVGTTGCMFSIERANDFVSLRNLISGTDTYRANIYFPPGTLSTATITKSTNDVVVVSNTNVTIGIQADSLMMIVPHKQMDIKCRSRLGGEWNRFFNGHLVSLDTFKYTGTRAESYTAEPQRIIRGGFTVNPDIPAGTGRVPIWATVSGTMPFLTGTNGMNNTTGTSTAVPYLLGKYNDMEYLDIPPDLADAGVTPTVSGTWEIKYTIAPGERLGVSSFPPRPYHWRKSFESNYQLINRSYSGTKTDPQNQTSMSNQLHGLSAATINIALLSETFCDGAWAAGGECEPPLGGTRAYRIKSGVNTLSPYVAASGTTMVSLLTGTTRALAPILYTSPRFYYTDNMQTFINEIDWIKTNHGISGIYYDCTPMDWVSTYQVMRETRALFPDGPVILHASISAPFYMPDIFCPFIDTYADITLRGETVPGEGIEWPFPKFAVSNYNVANSIGVGKSDNWDGLPPIDEVIAESPARETAAFLKCLQYGGRGRRSLDPDSFTEVYLPILIELENEWTSHGTAPNFFQEYYAPTARWLTAPYLNELP